MSFDQYQNREGSAGFVELLPGYAIYNNDQLVTDDAGYVMRADDPLVEAQPWKFKPHVPGHTTRATGGQKRKLVEEETSKATTVKK